jgi:peptidyl-prolyl cis-trans isomerase SurA
MRISTLLLLIVSIFLSHQLDAQQADDVVLLKIGEHKVTAGEFIRLYTKSNSANDTTTFEEYREQFINFRLKVAQAVDEGLDTAAAFKRELAGYRSQLATNYLIDNDARNKALRDIYTRLQTEVNAWHILVTCPPEAVAADTLSAYTRALELRARLNEGEPFEQVARAGSDDPSVVSNGGNLGYFTALQMILPFEDAAYRLKPGEISMPVRTPYGYHIIKVTGRRPSMGMIKVAHIMKAIPPGAADQAWDKAHSDILLISKKIAEGASFGELAKAESDHRESAASGGELEWLGTGDIIPEFAEAAFALLRNGDVSPPVRTAFGWHLIMRIDKRPIGSFEDNKNRIESRLSNGRLNNLARTSMVNKLKKEFNYRLDSEKFSLFVALTDSMLKGTNHKLDKQLIPTGNLFTFRGGSFKCSEFAIMIESNIQAFTGSNTLSLISLLIENISAEKLISYEDTLLEEKYPDFRYLIKEFHDGMLLFEINTREIWNRPYSDSAGLSRFYHENIGKFMGPPSADVKIYSSVNPSKIKALLKLVNKFGTRQGGDAKIMSRFTSGADTSVLIVNKRIYKGDIPEFDSYLSKRGSHLINYQAQESVILVTRTYPAEAMDQSAVMAELSLMYQEYLEEKWLKQLKQKYTVWVDENVMLEIRKKYYENR